jgi:hypothetical protein
MVDNDGALRAAIGAPIHSSMRAPRLRALPPCDDLAIFAGLKKCLWDRDFFARLDNRGTSSRAIPAAQMHGATMRMKRSAAFRASPEKIFHRRVARAVRGRKIARKGANQCR